LYPFSGPDILHALAFYPDAGEIILFGLEPPGTIPDPMRAPENKRTGHLLNFRKAISTILKSSFFVTDDMSKKIGKTPYASVTGILMFLLARGSFIITEVKHIAMDSSGVIIGNDNSRAGVIPGVEIIFHRQGQPALIMARYFQVDIQNSSKKGRVFINSLQKSGPVGTIIKSASYLMHGGTFSKIRKAILENSTCIIQDDSGIPYRYFDKKIWDITYHGYYHRPINYFRGLYQKDLNESIRKHSTGKLPFIYGYGYSFKDMTYHLLCASKKRQQSAR